MSYTKVVANRVSVLFVLLFVVFGISIVQGQTTASIVGQSIPALKQKQAFSTAPTTFSPKKSLAPTPYPALQTVFQQTTTVPKVYSYQELAFFCKIEVELEKSAGLPVKFRLGSVPYVDRLEGKGFGLNIDQH